MSGSWPYTTTRLPNRNSKNLTRVYTYGGLCSLNWLFPSQIYASRRVTVCKAECQCTERERHQWEQGLMNAGHTSSIPKLDKAEWRYMLKREKIMKIIHSGSNSLLLCTRLLAHRGCTLGSPLRSALAPGAFCCHNQGLHRWATPETSHNYNS